MPTSRPYRGASLKTVPRGAKVKTSVHRVQLLPGAIAIGFKGHSGTEPERVYVYTNESASEPVILLMKQLAKAGAGLNRFININQPRYVPNPELYTGGNISLDNTTANAQQLASGMQSNESGWWIYLGAD